MRRNRLRVYALVAAAAMAGALLVIIPALGQINEGDAVVFQLNADGLPAFTYGGTEQVISTARNGCQITSAETLIDLSAVGNQQPGLNSQSIGVKSTGSNSNGTPCSQVDATETLSIKPGSNLAGRTFAGVKLDLEMTGDAIVDVTFLPLQTGDLASTYSLHTGTSFTALCTLTPMANGCPGNSDDNTSTPPYEIESDTGVVDNACAAPNSSGPNNGGNDNCIWRIDPGYDVTEVVIEVRDVGTVSLEAGVDTGSPSRFYLANGAPDADDDAASVSENASGPQSILVLANDTDPENDSLTVTGVSAVTADSGVPTGLANYTASTATFDPNGQFEFLDDTETRTNTFTYTVSDGKGGTDTATVTVTINGANDDPVLASQLTVPEDATGTAAVVTVLTDVDVADQTTLSFTCTPQDATLGVSLVDNGDGTGTFSAPTDFFDDGGVTFSCSFSDGTANKTGSTVVVVTGSPDDPTANLDVAYADDAEIKTINVLANDFDVDNDAEILTITGVSNVPAGFSATHDGTQVTFQGPAEWSGSPVTFNYTIQDSTGRTAIGTVTVYEMIRCGESLQYSEGDVTATYERLGPEGCDAKPYLVDVLQISAGNAVLFQPRPQTGDPVPDCSVDPRPLACSEQFKGTLTFGTKPEANAANTGTLRYDPIAQSDPDNVVLRDMLWCEFDPFASDVTYADRPNAIPVGHSWCIVSATVTIADAANTSTTWVTFGIGDPWKIAT